MADEDKHCQTIVDHDCFICTKFKVLHIKMYSGDRKYCETVNHEYAETKCVYMYCEGRLCIVIYWVTGDRNIVVHSIKGHIHMLV